MERGKKQNEIKKFKIENVKRRARKKEGQITRKRLFVYAMCISSMVL